MRLSDLTTTMQQTYGVTDYVRLLACRTETSTPERMADLFLKRWPDSLHREIVQKAAVTAGTTTDSTWAGPLVVPSLAAAFLGLVRTASLTGRLPGVLNVPFNTRVPLQTSGDAYYWVSENAIKPTTKLAFSTGITLTPTKAEGIVVISRELARLSVPGTEPLFQRALVSGLTAFTDRQFLDPAVAAVAGKNPASITNAVTPTATGANVDATVTAVLAALFAARPGATGAVVITSPATAARIAGTGNNPDAKVSGGTVQGVPLVPSEGALTYIIAIDPSGVLIADGGVGVDVSEQADVELNDAPVGTAASVVTPLWQTNQVAFKVERMINYQAVAGAVQYAVAP